MIKINNISKKYRDKNIFNNFSAEFEEGQCTMLYGPSGKGKTTLLRIIAGLEKPESGKLEGIGRVSMVFQENRLCENLSAIDNIKLVVNNKMNSEIRNALIELGLEGDLDKNVSEYSGGMKRRVAIIRAYLAESDVVLLDEPFTGLDENIKNDVIEWMVKKANNRTVILVSHDYDDAKKMMCEKRILKLE